MAGDGAAVRTVAGQLIRSRACESADFVVEACDAEGRLGLPADLADRSLAAQARRHGLKCRSADARQPQRRDGGGFRGAVPRHKRDEGAGLGC
jgi:hypothetical protein